jgi:hypothetical protein
MQLFLALRDINKKKISIIPLPPIGLDCGVDGIRMNIELKRGNMIDSAPLEVGDHRLYKVLDNFFNTFPYC